MASRRFPATMRQACFAAVLSTDTRLEQFQADAQQQSIEAGKERHESTVPIIVRNRTILASGVLGWGKVAAGTAAAGVAIPMSAAEDSTIRLALIGCGGRGSGAIAKRSAPGGPVKLVAMADIFERRLESSHRNLSKIYPDKVDVPQERRFIGFDAFKKAIDCLRPGDVAALCTYPAFRVAHLDYAVAKGVNVFMEKSFATDPVGIRRVIKAGEEAEKKNLKVAAGLMCRHSPNRQS